MYANTNMKFRRVGAMNRPKLGEVRAAEGRGPRSWLRESGGNGRLQDILRDSKSNSDNIK